MKLKLLGKTKIGSLEINQIEGGFGENQKTILVKDIANIHRKKIDQINRAINRNKEKFEEGVDLIDLKNDNFAAHLLSSEIYTQNAMNASKNIYLLSQRGYLKLVKILEDPKAWEVYNLLLDDYFILKKEQREEYKFNGSIDSQFIYQLAKEMELKEKQIQEMKPKALFADAVSTSSTSILIGELAKLISQNGVEIGQNRLFKWLRSNNYLIKRAGESYNTPTQRSMDLGLMETKVRTISNPDGSVRTTRTTKITGKGQIYFINKFLDESKLKELA